MKQFWNGGYVNTLRFFYIYICPSLPHGSHVDTFSISLIILSRNYSMKTKNKLQKELTYC